MIIHHFCCINFDFKNILKNYLSWLLSFLVPFRFYFLCECLTCLTLVPALNLCFAPCCGPNTQDVAWHVVGAPDLLYEWRSIKGWYPVVIRDQTLKLQGISLEKHLAYDLSFHLDCFGPVKRTLGKFYANLIYSFNHCLLKTYSLLVTGHTTW